MFTITAKGMKSLELYFRNEKRAHEFAERLNAKSESNRYSVRPLTADEIAAIH